MGKPFLPSVKKYERLDGEFIFDKPLRVVFESKFYQPARLLVEKVLPHFRISLTDDPTKANIIFSQSLADKLDFSDKLDYNKLNNNKFVNNKSIYNLIVLPNKILINCQTEQLAFYAVQTFLQMLPSYIYSSASNYQNLSGQECIRIAACQIYDWPEFTWRGCHLDVARHFFPKRDIIGFIDIMAMHKLNILHWHLTDDQGWRVEIKGYPKLTQIGAFRKRSQVGGGSPKYDKRPHGGFYTQNDLKEIVAYAKSRGISIIPEIDIPGHSQAAIAAYPQLGVDYADGNLRKISVWDTWGVSFEILNAEELTFRFLENVFGQICDIFPAKVIMIGGDECPVDKWDKSPRIKYRMKQLGVQNTGQLRNYFIKLIVKFLQTYHRQVMCWNDILEFNPPKDIIIACWTDSKETVLAVEKGYKVVNMPQQRVYFDWKQSNSPQEPIPVAKTISLKSVYNFDPVKNITKIDSVLGSQAALWSEHFDSFMRLEDAAWPRLSALAEVLWGKSDNNYNQFLEVLKKYHLPRFDFSGVNYRSFDGIPLGLQRPGVIGRET
ncbi:MAG: beta-N-acetylhexosaminidase [Bifidobacteriaceae bacterium]|jgi:hexosaminidase|nr:beta-N-acetylhexosaminidase [Bifidobacteriaceae bacterium]